MVRMKFRNGFTLIELLVVIAIIALLLAIITPALRMAKEHAQRTRCASNLKSIGVGLMIYTDSFDDKLIPNGDQYGNEFTEGLPVGYRPWKSSMAGVDIGSSEYLKPIQLGKLFSQSIIDTPESFYCNTAQITLPEGNTFNLDYYMGSEIIKFMPPDKSYGWGVPTPGFNVHLNYMYYAWNEVKATKVPGHRAVVFDCMSTVAHRKGEKPYGMNALFHDGHVNLTLMSSNPVLLECLTRDTLYHVDRPHNDYSVFVKCLKLLDP